MWIPYGPYLWIYWTSYLYTCFNYCIAHKKEDAEAAVQSLGYSVLIWSQEWKLNLSADRSEVCPISAWSNESTWKPSLFIGTLKIWANITLRLLGAILNRSFIFNTHLKKLSTSLSSSLYHQSHSTHFLGLASFHSEDGLPCFNPQQGELCSSCMAALAFRH